MKKLLPWAFTLLLVSLLFLPTRVATAQLIATLEGHTDNVWSVAFSPDGQMLASGSWDETIRLWDVETEQLLNILTGHTDDIMSVAFSLDGQTLASASWDGTIRLWNPNTGEHIRTLTDHKGVVGSLAFSPNGQTLASGGEHHQTPLLLWNTTTWQVERTLTGHTQEVETVAFSPDGNTLASGSRDGTIRLWNPNTGKHIRTLTATAKVNRLAFSLDGATLASSSGDQTIQLWNPHTGALKGTLSNQGGPVAFSPDGRTLAIGGQGISLWDTDTEKYKTSLIRDIGYALSVVFSPDGQTVASGSADNLVRLLESTPPEVPFVNIPFDVNNIPEPVPPPQGVRDFFGLSDFWQQWINIEGFPILASAKVNPYVLKELAWQIGQMFRDRPDLLTALAKIRETFTLIGHDELMGDIPEMQHLPLLFFHNVRSGGGWYPRRGTSVASVLSSASVPVHELAHDIHLLVLNRVDSTFDNRLKKLYDAVVAKDLWYGAAVNYKEYWAEAVTVWFHVPQLSPLKTREALKAYDPDVARLVAEVFGENDWRHTPIERRLHLPHLQGFDLQSAPRRREFPPGVEEAYEELRDPAINERDEWVNLPPYAPSLVPSLNELRNREGRSPAGTDMLVVNTIDAQILLYWVNPDGTETLNYRFHPKPWAIYHINPRVGDLLLAKDNTGRPLAVFQAVEKTGRVLLTPTFHLITPGLSKSSGDNQAAVSGVDLANPFVVEVRDENLSVLEGIVVTFTVTAGDGTLSVTHTTTDKNGRAESTLTLGLNRGINTVSVSATGIEGRVIFNAVAEAAIDIPDSNLRAAIETALGKAAGDPITSSEIATLTHLEARNANISDLTGLEHATDLTYLDLGFVDAEGRRINSNSVSNLSSLVGLTKLTYLNLWGNSISDISLLAGLTKLTQLELSNNSISDISSVAGLTNLTYLDLDGNSISDISPVAGLINLTFLDIWGTPISDISPVAGLTNLTVLGLGHNSISNISPVSGLINLTLLWLRYNSISDLSPLVANIGLGSGDTVYVQGNPLSYLSIHTYIPVLQNRGVTVEYDADGTRPADVNGDGNVDVLDLILVTSHFGNTGGNIAADVSGNGVVDVLDLVLVAGMFQDTAAAPSVQHVPETLTAVEVQGWLIEARRLEGRDSIIQRGILVLEQLLISLTPKETELLANYPNPFNPETWIPYRLAEDAFVTLTIYNRSGQVVRRLDVGHRIASSYESRSKAIYWDGRNDIGEQVAGGVYFYTLSAGDYSATQKMVILK